MCVKERGEHVIGWLPGYSIILLLCMYGNICMCACVHCKSDRVNSVVCESELFITPMPMRLSLLSFTNDYLLPVWLCAVDSWVSGQQWQWVHVYFMFLHVFKLFLNL